MVKARVFPIEPFKEVKIQLSYDQKVKKDGALSRFTYPLFSLRPEKNGAVKSLLVDVNINTKTPLKTVYCPGFKTSVKKTDPNKARLTFEGTNFKPSKDFEVVFGESKQRIGVDFLTYKKGDDGYFMMFLNPDSELQAQEIKAKDITFVVDTSGSMQGDKIKQAKEALKFCVNSLNPQDRFNIISFSTDVYPFQKNAVDANDDNKKKAIEFIKGIRAIGGTAIYDALQMSLKAEVRADAVGMNVFLTDGRPTIGNTDIKEILKQFDNTDNKSRFFTFGVGFDVNTDLLSGIASKTHGFAEFVKPEEDLELALSGFYTKISSPVMSDLKIDSADLRLTKMNPGTLPNLFRGEQVIVTGRYQGKGKKSMKCSGIVNKTREFFNFDADLDGQSANGFIPRIWASSRVGYLMEQIKLNGTKKELVDEIKHLGRQYAILTPYTSFLIVEEGMNIDELADIRRKGDRVSRNFTQASSGKEAVENAIKMKKMQESASAPGVSVDGDVAGGAFFSDKDSETKSEKAFGYSKNILQKLVKVAFDKTFYLRQKDGYMYDSLIAAGTQPKIDMTVKAYSIEFFKLLKDVPLLVKYLKAGDQLVIKIDGKVYKITKGDESK